MKTIVEYKGKLYLAKQCDGMSCCLCPLHNECSCHVPLCARFGLRANTYIVGEIKLDIEAASKEYGKRQYEFDAKGGLPDKCRACYAPQMQAFENGAKYLVEQLTRQ